MKNQKGFPVEQNNTKHQHYLQELKKLIKQNEVSATTKSSASKEIHQAKVSMATIEALLNYGS